MLVGKPEGNNYLDNADADRIILKRIFRKLTEGVWTGSIWLMKGTGGGHL
jgi:hypothetical protein